MVLKPHSWSSVSPSKSHERPCAVSVACFDREVWIRVEGRGNFQGCASLKKFVEAMIGRGYRLFVVDLAACEHMDSTFMGTLTGISQNLRIVGEGSLRALNVSPRNVELFENLGLNHLFSVEPAGAAPVAPAEQGPGFFPALRCRSGARGGAPRPRGACRRQSRERPSVPGRAGIPEG